MLQRPERVVLLSAPQAFFGLAFNGWPRAIIIVCSPSRPGSRRSSAWFSSMPPPRERTPLTLQGAEALSLGAMPAEARRALVHKEIRASSASDGAVVPRPATGKLGILTPGLGAVATTFMAGVESIRRGHSKPIGSLTQMATIRLGKRTDNRSPLIKDFVPLA